MRRLHDPAEVRPLLETDRVWCGYALADLDPEQWPHTEWHADGGAVLLLYHAVAPPFLFTHGAVTEPLLEVAQRHSSMLLSVPEHVCAALESRGYRLRQVKRMVRMGLSPGAFARHASTARPLDPHDLRAVQTLHADGDIAGERPDFFLPAMLASGTYFGIFDGKELTAAAGTHIVSQRESVAAVGNVYVKRSHRGRGLGQAVTSAVVGGLIDRGIRTIVLSVEHSNAAAIVAYSRLGFTAHTEFIQALAIVEE